jgi:hypothetical protein
VFPQPTAESVAKAKQRVGDRFDTHARGRVTFA